jgi:hypothetical protein
MKRFIALSLCWFLAFAPAYAGGSSPVGFPLVGGPVVNGTNGTLLSVGSTGLLVSSNTLASGTTTTSQPFTFTQTWNAGGVAFTGFVVNATDSASASTSLLLDLQIAGVSKFKVDKAGVITSANGTLVSAMTDTWNNAGTVFTSIGMNITNTNSAALSRLLDLQIGGSPVFQVAKDTSANLFNAYTSDTNYEKGGMFWASNVFKIGTQKGGSGGTARDTYIITPNRQIVLSDASATTSFPGNVAAAAGFNGFIVVGSGGISANNADGVFRLLNNAQTGFGRVNVGPRDGIVCFY